jgi:hypothetical protein
MAQLIAAQNDNGIVLAADSKAIEFDLDGNPVYSTVNRLLPLGDHAAILAGGATHTVGMARSLQAFVSGEGLTDVEDIYKAAIPYLGGEYERFMRKECETLHLDPLLHTYFILAGYTDRDPGRPARLYLLWNKKRLPQLDGDEITWAFAVPRRIGLEAKLARLAETGASTEAILDEVRSALNKLEATEEEIGGPFVFATLTADGLHIADFMGVTTPTTGFDEANAEPEVWSRAA